ncbi:MAG: OPT/YSL family transporter, partial [Eggerthellaceae bacterium]|nr:OPT/YSL family transporter [Eggerthellaceae bacterium]
VVVMGALLGAYGASSFGPGGSFIAAQASVVATMVAGVPSMPAFLAGLTIGFVLYLLGAPVMMLGLGIYLPFCMSFTVFLGAMAKLVFDAVGRRRARGKLEEEREARTKSSEESGLIVASGLLGGESVVGIIIAFIVVAMSLAA